MFWTGDPSYPYLIVEMGSYVLAYFVFRHAWRETPAFLMIVLAAIVFGYIAEYLAVTTVKPPYPHPYHYNYFIIKLPGPIPFEICLGWGLIFYSVMLTAKRSNIPWQVQPIFSGLLATGIDFVLDPIAVYLNFWTWNMPVQWFGIPWGNYTGWFVVVVAFSFMHILGYRWFPPCRPPTSKKGIARDFLVAFIAIIPSFIAYYCIMLAYEKIVSVVPEELMVAIIFGFSGLLVLSYVLRFKRDNPMDWAVLALPLYLYGCSSLLLFFFKIYEKYQDLVIIVPAFFFLGMLWFLMPSMDKLFSPGKKQGI